MKNKNYKKALLEINDYLDKYYVDIKILNYKLQIYYFYGYFEEMLEPSKNYKDDKKIGFKHVLANKQLGNIEEARQTFLNLYKKYKCQSSLLQLIYIELKKENMALVKKFYFLLDDNLYDDYRVKVVKRYIYSYMYPGLIEILKEDNSLDYYSKQIIDYNKKRAIHNIKKISSEKTFEFDSKIIISEFFNKLKDFIKDKEPTSFNCFDKYIIRVPNCVYINGIKTDYVAILTNINTKNIVNIFPIETHDLNVPTYEELSFDSKIYQYKNINSSQIEKFNKRYGFSAN